MLKSATGMQTHNRKVGFTLIEILVVIVIIGIIASVAVMSFGDFGERRRIITSAEHFVYFFGLVKKESMLEARSLAIQVSKDKYRVLELKNHNWQPLKDRIFKSQKLPHGAKMFLFVSKSSPRRDLIVINPAGDITPFKLKFGKDKNNIYTTIIGKHGGNIKRDEYGQK